MREICSGNHGAFATLYDRHAPQLYGLALRILRNQVDAEAIVSDVFVEVWTKPDRFDESLGSCRTYLLIMARSRAIDRLRASKTRHEKSHTAAEIRTEDEITRQKAESPARMAIAEERRELIRKAVAELKEVQREPLTLAFFEGLTHCEIAERLGQPLGTVKTRIRSGLNKLRTALHSTMLAPKEDDDDLS